VKIHRITSKITQVFSHTCLEKKIVKLLIRSYLLMLKVLHFEMILSILCVDVVKSGRKW
jgi:hypothetical protein